MTGYRVPSHLRRRTENLAKVLAVYGATAAQFQVYSHLVEVRRWDDGQIPLAELLETTGWRYRDASEGHVVKWVTISPGNRPHTGSVYAEGDKDEAVVASCFTAVVERLTYGIFDGRVGTRLIDAVDVTEEFAHLRAQSENVIICVSCTEQRPKDGSYRSRCSSCRGPVEYTMGDDDGS